MSEEELFLELPWSIIDAGKGLSMDLGGSLIKVVYLHTDDWVEASKRKQGSNGRLRLAIFEQGKLDEALSCVKRHAHIIRDMPDETVQIYTTGLTHPQVTKVTKELNVKNISLTETNCFAQSCVYLMKNMPRKDFLTDLYRPAYDEMKKKVGSYLEMMDKLKDMSAGMPTIGVSNIEEPRAFTTDRDKPITEEEAIFPCVIYMCGSTCQRLVVQKDGSFTAKRGSKAGERMFLGLGSLLSGGKTYGELMQLAERGNAFNIGVTNTQLAEGIDKDEESMYTAFTDEKAVEEMAFFFGQAVGKTIDDFKKEDTIRCLLETVLQEMTHGAHTMCQAADVKHIFFCGGFTEQPIVRELMSREWLDRDVIFAMFFNKPMGEKSFYFPKHGTHLGALGAYMKPSQGNM